MKNKIMDYLIKNRWERWHEGDCTYCGEHGDIRHIGFGANYGGGSTMCRKCNEAMDIKIEEACKEEIKNVPTKDQLKYRKKRDNIINSREVKT